MTVNEIMKEQLALQQQINDLKKKLNAEGWARFQKVIPALFNEYPGLKQLAIRGWTPGFNDGEACTHTTEYYVGNDMWAEFDEDKYWDVEKDDYKEVNQLTDEEARNIYKVLQSFDDILENQYHTAWELMISRIPESNELKWDKDYYECGY